MPIASVAQKKFMEAVASGKKKTKSLTQEKAKELLEEYVTVKNPKIPTHFNPRFNHGHKI